MSSFNLRGSYLDGHGAGEALGNGYDFWNYWDQPEASALLFGTPPSQALLNLESMDVHPSPLAHQPGGVNLMFQIVKARAEKDSAKDANVRNEQAFNHFSAARPGSSRSSNITETDKKGQEKEAAKDQVARKRMNDRTYRERCKKSKMETERNLELLSKENDRLKGENAYFKTEAVRTGKTLQSQEQEMKQLRKTIGLLKQRHDKQNTLVEVLSERLAGAKDADLQRENTQLKSSLALLRNQVNDRNNLDKLQLQEKNAQLEHEKRSLEMIVQALCEKISNEKGPEGDLAG